MRNKYRGKEEEPIGLVPLGHVAKSKAYCGKAQGSKDWHPCNCGSWK